MKNLCKSRAKPKHYEERKTFYRSDTRQPKLLDQVRNRIRCKHYSIRTEQAYIEWIRKFIFYHGKRHPAEMGENEISKGVKSPGSPYKTVRVNNFNKLDIISSGRT